MTKEDTLLKRDLLYFTTPETVDGYAKDVYEAMDEWAKQQSIAFAEWKDRYTDRDIEHDNIYALKDFDGAWYKLPELYSLFLEHQKKQQ